MSYRQEFDPALLIAQLEQHGWTHRELCRRTLGQISEMQVSAWKRGLYQPSVEQLAAVARAFGRPMEAFLTERQPEPEEVPA